MPRKKQNICLGNEGDTIKGIVKIDQHGDKVEAP